MELAVRHRDVTLRPPEPRDAPALFALASDPEVTRWFSWGPYAEESQALAYVERAARRRRAGEQLDLVVVRDGVGPVGVTGLSELSRRDRRAIVGSWLGRAHWGTGVNAQAKRALLHLAFAELGLRRVGAYTDRDNARSQRALEKEGFVCEGLLRDWHRHGDVQKDTYMFGLLLAEWRDRPRAEVVVEGDVPAAFVLA